MNTHERLLALVDLWVDEDDDMRLRQVAEANVATNADAQTLARQALRDALAAGRDAYAVRLSVYAADAMPEITEPHDVWGLSDPDDSDGWTRL
jgi:hypothetical protein